jgi:hypothetical protein
VACCLKFPAKVRKLRDRSSAARARSSSLFVHRQLGLADPLARAVLVLLPLLGEQVLIRNRDGDLRQGGARPHLTNATRMLLAKFFKVHPGYLVDDPEGFHTELISDVRQPEIMLFSATRSAYAISCSSRQMMPLGSDPEHAVPARSRYSITMT